MLQVLGSLVVSCFPNVGLTWVQPVKYSKRSWAEFPLAVSSLADQIDPRQVDKCRNCVIPRCLEPHLSQFQPF